MMYVLLLCAVVVSVLGSKTRSTLLSFFPLLGLLSSHYLVPNPFTLRSALLQASLPSHDLSFNSSPSSGISEALSSW
jgi:hypothetical protein